MGFKKSYASVLAAILVISCVWYSLSDYEMPTFTIEVEAADEASLENSKIELLERPNETPVTPQGSTSVAAVDDKNATYKDGVYYGTGTGFGGAIKVKVVIKDGKIKSIEIVSNNETPSYLAKAKAVIKAILNKQSTNVDTVSGATYSSTGIIKAVRSALSKAKVKDSSKKSRRKSSKKTNKKKDNTKPVQTGNFPYPDGTYTGTAFGFSDDITVNVTIRNKTITKIVVVSQDDTPEFFNKALKVLIRTVFLPFLNNSLYDRPSHSLDGSQSVADISIGYREAAHTLINVRRQDLDP